MKRACIPKTVPPIKNLRPKLERFVIASETHHYLITASTKRMLLTIIGFAILSASLLPLTSAQATTGLDSNGKCGFPLNFTGFPMDSCKMYGTWYEYKYLTPGIVDANVFGTYLPIGIASSSPLTVSMQWNSQSLLRDANGQYQCTPRYQLANFTSSGNRFSNSYTVNGTINSVFYTMLFTDYDNVEIFLTCRARSTTRPEFCDQPFIFVNARLRGPSVPAATKTYIDTVINRVLQPFCYSTTDLTTTDWNTALPFPPCPSAVPPTRFATDVTNLKTALQNNGGCYRFSGLPG